MLPWWTSSSVAVALGVIVAIVELRTDEIPNFLSLPTLGAGLVMGVVDKHPGDHVAGLLVAALVTGVLYRHDWLGGGGVKWTCAVAALIGFRLGALMMMVSAGLALVLLGAAKLRKRELYVPSSPLVLVGVVAGVVNVLLRRS